MRSELETIEGKSREGDPMPLVFLHDVGWPCGRRDLYYSPESLPKDAVHPYTCEGGVTLGSSTFVQGGFRSHGEFAFAMEEGGPANGVLTAVEDFLQGRERLAFVNVPCIFGLGVVYEKSAPYASALAHHLQPYDGNVLLGRLEENRLTLYLRVLELQDLTVELHDQLDESRLRTRDVATENRALWFRTAELEGEISALRTELEHLLRSRAFALVEKLSTPAKVRGTEGVSRQRLRAALDRHQVDISH